MDKEPDEKMKDKELFLTDNLSIEEKASYFYVRTLELFDLLEAAEKALSIEGIKEIIDENKELKQENERLNIAADYDDEKDDNIKSLKEEKKRLEKLVQTLECDLAEARIKGE